MPKKSATFWFVVDALLVIALLGLAFAFFVWPTPYRTFKGEDGGPHRINRFNGREEELIGDGWYPKELLHPVSDTKKTP